MKISIVCVHYYAGQAAGTLRALGRLIAQLDSPTQIHVANTDSAWLELQSKVPTGSKDQTVIAHSNAGFEFGAYQAGLTAVRERGVPEWLVFANDTFHRHQVFPAAYLDYLAMHLSRKVAHPIIAGQVEGLPRSYQLAGIRTHRWITTNLFALNTAALEAIGWRIYDERLDDLVSETPALSTFFSKDVDEVLRDHITTWLFAHRGADVAWYGAAPLSASNVRRMAGKARSIMQEKALSARLEGASAEFASIQNISVVEQVALKLRIRAIKMRKLGLSLFDRR